MNYIFTEDYLAHHGVKGMKWGVRKYQNADGSLTPAGMKRYGIDSNGKMSKQGKARYRMDYAKQNMKDSNKRVSLGAKTLRDGFGFANKNSKSMTDYTNARVDYQMKKAKYKSKGDDKREKYMHIRNMSDTGYINLKNVEKGKSSSLYNTQVANTYFNKLKKEKGENYANEILKKSKNSTVALIATSGAVALGSTFLSMYLQSKR